MTRPESRGPREVAGASNGGVAIQQHSQSKPGAFARVTAVTARGGRLLTRAQSCWAHAQAARVSLDTALWLASIGRPAEAREETTWALHHGRIARSLGHP